MAGAKTIPVAPVNPSAHVEATSSLDLAPPATPGVVNLVNLANKPSAGEGVYTSVSDPARRGSEAATVSKDWTIHRPTPEKVEDPPPVPIYKILMEHIKSLWAASANAVQVPQVKHQQDLLQPNPNTPSGQIATEALTYTPGKVNKTENVF